MENDETSNQAAYSERQLDMESLKALAHPLRVQILDTLSVYGAFTASGLAERLGESSGATSYHLRQLEKHGFVREVEGRGSGRERWWERVPGYLNLDATQLEDTPTMRQVTRTVVNQWETSRSALLKAFQDRGFDELPREWMTATNVATANLKLTAAQLKEITDAWQEFIDSHVEKYRGQTGPGLRPVQIQFNAFPVMDAPETTADSVGG